jgi:PCFT/HCP family folate transporter-like MFS transporter 1/3
MPEEDSCSIRETSSSSSSSSSASTTTIIESITATQTTLTPTGHSRWLTLELGIFLVTLGQALSGAVITQLLLVRNCQRLFPLNATKCDLLVYEIDTQEARELEEVLEPRVSILLMYKTVFEACIPVILSLFVGPWSDHHGRKPLLLWPVFGMFFQF